MSTICIATAAALIALPTAEVTVAWTHSIEKVRWEEDYRAEGGKLVATRARIRGSGAGMEPSEDARLVDGWWVYAPPIHTHDALRLTRSPYTADYELCWSGRCHPLTDYAPISDGITELRACPDRPG